MSCVCVSVTFLVYTYWISPQCKGQWCWNFGQRTTGPRIICECVLVEVGGRLGVNTGHFIMSIWPKLHHRFVRLRWNSDQRTAGPRLICKCILVEVGGRLGVNMGHFISIQHFGENFCLVQDRLWPNSGQRTTGTRLMCEWILVEIGGRLGVNMGQFSINILIFTITGDVTMWFVWHNMNGMSYLEFRLSTVYMFFQNNPVPIPTCLELPTRVVVLVQTRPTTCSYYVRAHLARGKVMDHSHFTTVTVKDQSHFTTSKVMDQSHFTAPR